MSLTNKLFYTISSIGLKYNNNGLDLFLSDKYLEDIVDSKKYKNEISFTRRNRDDFIEDVEFLDIKYEKYVLQIAEILNVKNNQNYNHSFWKKSLGLGFRRFIHLTYDSFKIHNANFHPEKFDFAVLSENNFITINNFELHRECFQHSEIGFEQLFSIYIKTFYSDIENIKYFKKEQKKISSVNKSLISKSLNRLKNISPSKFIYKILKLILRFKKPKVGLLGAFFDSKYRNILLSKSFGDINDIKVKENFNYSKIDINTREKLFKNFIIESDFDKFFLNALVYTFPTFFIEDYSKGHEYYLKQVSAQKKLSYIISESWLSSTHISFFLALGKAHYNIKHIYNEHNYLSHPYLGNHLKLVLEIVDIYYTVGWKSKNKYENIKQGASLFEFKIPNIRKKKKQILYIAPTPSVKLAEINAAYGEIQENAIKYLNFKTIFFDNLNSIVYKDIIYRRYPLKETWMEFKDFSININKIHSVDDFSKTAKQMMKQAKLVIVDYLSTSHLESLIMDIPTVVFFNKNTYYLENDYINTYDELINAKIFHTSPTDAAIFVNEICDDVDKWWYSEKVQNARNKFLNENIGNPKDAIKFYLNLLK